MAGSSASMAVKIKVHASEAVPFVRLGVISWIQSHPRTGDPLNQTKEPKSKNTERKSMKKSAIVLCLLLAIGSVQVQAQVSVDRDLLAEISRIKAIDNHAHPLKYVAAGEKPDDEYDALPLDAIEPFPLPVRLSPANPEF